MSICIFSILTIIVIMIIIMLITAVILIIIIIMRLGLHNVNVQHVLNIGHKKGEQDYQNLYGTLYSSHENVLYNETVKSRIANSYDGTWTKNGKFFFFLFLSTEL